MKTVTLNLSDSVASFLQLRAAIDDQTLEQGLELLLTKMADDLFNKLEKIKAADVAKAAGKIRKPRETGAMRGLMRHAE